MNCLWVPSEQSKSRTSGPHCIAVEVRFLSTEGMAPLVPKKTMFT